MYANSVPKNGTRYFTIGPFRSSDWNIYSRDQLGKIDRLPPHINSEGYEDGPFIAPDESYLIFESDRGNATEKNIDLYICFSTTKGTWTVPLNMGPEINSAASERFVRVLPDGKYLFFCRNACKGIDIFWMNAKIIRKLKKQAVKFGILN